MRTIDTFACQHWLITPAALAKNEGSPATGNLQKWHVVLTGVTMVNLKGEGQSDWLRETLVILPDFRAPLRYAIGQYAIPTPPGLVEGTNYTVELQLIQFAPFAAPSATFNEGASNNSGFAVDAWNPHTFRTGTDILTNNHNDKLFNGFKVDVAVRDTDAWLYRVSYNFNLLGYIVYTGIQF